MIGRYGHFRTEWTSEDFIYPDSQSVRFIICETIMEKSAFLHECSIFVRHRLDLARVRLALVKTELV